MKKGQKKANLNVGGRKEPDIFTEQYSHIRWAIKLLFQQSILLYTGTRWMHMNNIGSAPNNGESLRQLM